MGSCGDREWTHGSPQFDYTAMAKSGINTTYEILLYERKEKPPPAVADGGIYYLGLSRI